MATQRDAAGAALSLLFTPKSKSADGAPESTPADVRAFPGMGRTPASAGRGHSGAAAGQPSRRRSLTPGSSRQQDTPPPPPTNSLLDSPGGRISPWGQDGAEDMQVSTSPYGVAAAARTTPGVAAGQELTRATLTLEAMESTWVTVFGFGPDDLPLVIREFSKAGDIQRFGTFGEAAQVNWVHIQYQNKHAMQRALLRNGDRLSARVMVGVKPLDPEDSVAVKAQVGSSGADGTSFAVAVPKLQQTRPYTVGSAADAGSMLPLASKGLSQRVKEFILGC